jgi:hypothetical protein
MNNSPCMKIDLMYGIMEHSLYEEKWLVTSMSIVRGSATANLKIQGSNISGRPQFFRSPNLGSRAKKLNLFVVLQIT